MISRTMTSMPQWILGSLGYPAARNMKQEAIVEVAYGWAVKIVNENVLNRKLEMWQFYVDGVITILQESPDLLVQVRGVPPIKSEVLCAIDTLISQNR